MGLLKQLIEEPTTLVSFKRITKGVRMITVHPMLNSYANSAELDRRDLAYIITKTVLYFKNCLWLSLSTIEKFHVRKFAEDTMMRIKGDFREIIEIWPVLVLSQLPSSLKFRILYNTLLNRIKPVEIHLEIAQRMMTEVYCVPIEIMRDYEDTLQIPPHELDYLARLQHRLNNPFTGDDYQK